MLITIENLSLDTLMTLLEICKEERESYVEENGSGTIPLCNSPLHFGWGYIVIHQNSIKIDAVITTDSNAATSKRRIEFYNNLDQRVRTVSDRII